MYREASTEADYRVPHDQVEVPLAVALEDAHDSQFHGESLDDAAVAPGPAPRRRRVSLWPAFDRRALIAAALVLAVVSGSIAAAHWWVSGRYMVSTDDAYVRAHNTTLASKISGYVASIPIEDNTAVRAGDVIATIDDGDYRLATDAAREKAATQQATVDRIGRQVIAQGANVDQAKAEMASAQANAKKTELEFARQQALAAQSFASRQALEQAEANRDQAAAAVQSAQAGIDAAAANLDVLKAQQQEAIHTLDELKTALAKAERDLSFTAIRAPVDGVFSNRGVQTGDYVQTGQRIAEPGAARRHLYRGQFQGDATGRGCVPARRCRSASTRYRNTPSRARSRALRRPRAPCSRCCRLTTRPAISPRSCSACRSASRFRLGRHSARAAAGHVGRRQRQYQVRARPWPPPA